MRKFIFGVNFFVIQTIFKFINSNFAFILFPNNNNKLLIINKNIPCMIIIENMYFLIHFFKLRKLFSHSLYLIILLDYNFSDIYRLFFLFIFSGL